MKLKQLENNAANFFTCMEYTNSFKFLKKQITDIAPVEGFVRSWCPEIEIKIKKRQQEIHDQLMKSFNNFKAEYDSIFSLSNYTFTSSGECINNVLQKEIDKVKKSHEIT